MPSSQSHFYPCIKCWSFSLFSLFPFPSLHVLLYLSCTLTISFQSSITCTKTILHSECPMLRSSFSDSISFPQKMRPKCRTGHLFPGQAVRDACSPVLKITRERPQSCGTYHRTHEDSGRLSGPSWLRFSICPWRYRPLRCGP